MTDQERQELQALATFFRAQEATAAEQQAAAERHLAESDAFRAHYGGAANVCEVRAICWLHAASGIEQFLARTAMANYPTDPAPVCWGFVTIEDDTGTWRSLAPVKKDLGAVRCDPTFSPTRR